MDSDLVDSFKSVTRFMVKAIIVVGVIVGVCALLFFIMDLLPLWAVIIVTIIWTFFSAVMINYLDRVRLRRKNNV